MAIFIIDQFSLNTDLPLDIRYVPDGGRFDPDISIYKYPGMQVYDTNTQTVWHTDNSLNWVEIGGDTDASLNQIYNILNSLDASIVEINNELTVIDASLTDINNTLIIHDASIGNLEIRVTSLESSVAFLDSSVNQLFAGQAAQDASIVDLRSDVTTLDASIVRLDGEIVQIEASIGDINVYQDIQDASIAAGLTGLSQLDASIVRLDGEITQIEASIGDINTYQDIQDGSIAALEASLGSYVKKSGDTMTGDLIINAGLEVTGDTSVNNLHVAGNEVVLGDLNVGGNLTVDGSVTYINVEQLNVSDNFINLNTGLTGIPPATLQSGISVQRGDLEPYVFLFDEDTQTFRIGIAQETSTGYLDSSTQAVATRENNPLSDGVAYWNSAEQRFDTSAGLIFDPETGQLTLDGSLRLTGYVAASGEALVVGPDGTIQTAPIPSVANFTTFAYVDGSLAARDTSIAFLDAYNDVQDASIAALEGDITQIEASIGDINSSITAIDLSINELYTLDASNIKGAVNVGDGSAGIFRDVSNGLLTFRELVGSGAATVTENGDLIEIGIDASFGGEVNTASNLGSGEGLFANKVAQDLQFKSLKTNDPSTVIITQDASQVYIDVSIGKVETDVSVGGLIDTSINESTLATHQILEFNEDGSIWENTNEILWDTSTATTTDDVGGIPAGTDLEGLTLKEVLYKILYEYQVPVLDVSGSPVGGVFEKGSSSTQFASIDIGWTTNNSNYPLALLNSLRIEKTGAGTIFDTSLGLVASDSNSYTDATGITNWGGTNRTITYQVEIDDNQGDQPQPAVIDQVNYTFFYPQRWGLVPRDTSVGGIDSTTILGLDGSILQGQTDLTVTFDNPTSDQIQYLYAYPDTVLAPDNFGSLAEIIDQNGYDVTGSFSNATTDVSTDGGNVRYRFYLLDNWVDTSTFDITFKF